MRVCPFFSPLEVTRKDSWHSKRNYFGQEDKHFNYQVKAKQTVCQFWWLLCSVKWHLAQRCPAYRFGRAKPVSSHGRVDLPAENLASKQALWYASLVLLQLGTSWCKSPWITLYFAPNYTSTNMWDRLSHLRIVQSQQCYTFSTFSNCSTFLCTGKYCRQMERKLRLQMCQSTCQ